MINDNMSYLPEVINVLRKPESTSIVSLSEHTTYLNEMLEKNKRDLAEELMWLLETLKATQQKHKNEVQGLQDQCANHLKVEVRLNTELKNSREGEEAWRLRCLATEKIQTTPFDQGISPKDRLVRTSPAGSLQGINETCSLADSSSMPKLPHNKPDTGIALGKGLLRTRSAGIMHGRNKTCSLGDNNNNNIRQLPDKNRVLSFCDNIRSWSSGGLRGENQDLAEKPGQNAAFTLSVSSRSNKPPSNKPLSNKPPSNGKYKEAEAHMRKMLDLRMSSMSTGATLGASIHSDSTKVMNKTSNVDTAEEKECFAPTEIRSDGKMGNPNQFYPHDNVPSQGDISLKITSRDNIIVGLEKTLNQQLNIIQNMQKEMTGLVEAKSVKEKSLTASHKQTEDCLKKLVLSLQEKLDTNAMLYKFHIQEQAKAAKRS